MIWLLACTPEPAHLADSEAVLTFLAGQTGDEYRALADNAAKLATDSTTYCTSLDDLGAPRTSWLGSRAPLKRAEVVQFGPMVEYPLRLKPKLDDWPVIEDAVEELIAGEDDLSVEAFGARGTAVRGLPVAEYLLWTDAEWTTRRCEALEGVTGDIVVSADQLVAAWDDEWSWRLTEPDAWPDDAYDSRQEVVDEWVNRMGFTVENIRATKLGKPVGDSSGGEPQPDTLESRYSGTSLTDARNALAGVHAVWAGDPGIRDLVQDRDVASNIDALFGEAIEKLAAVPDPLEDTITSNPEAVAAAQALLLDLQVAIQVDLASALSVTITFNDNDGD